MNEPFMGSLARNAFDAATMKIKEQVPQFGLNCPSDITTEQQALFMGYVTERLQEFDRTTLMDFYRRIWRAVSRYSRKPLVTGGNIYSSSTIRTGIGRLQNPSAEGKGIQIYAPHGYDSVIDSDRYENFSKENIRSIIV